jgi:hypothetical protein
MEVKEPDSDSDSDPDSDSGQLDADCESDPEFYPDSGSDSHSDSNSNSDFYRNPSHTSYSPPCISSSSFHSAAPALVVSPSSPSSFTSSHNVSLFSPILLDLRKNYNSDDSILDDESPDLHLRSDVGCTDKDGGDPRHRSDIGDDGDGNADGNCDIKLEEWPATSYLTPVRGPNCIMSSSAGDSSNYSSSRDIIIPKAQRIRAHPDRKYSTAGRGVSERLRRPKKHLKLLSPEGISEYLERGCCRQMCGSKLNVTYEEVRQRRVRNLAMNEVEVMNETIDFIRQHIKRPATSTSRIKIAWRITGGRVCCARFYRFFNGISKHGINAAITFIKCNGELIPFVHGREVSTVIPCPSREYAHGVIKAAMAQEGEPQTSGRIRMNSYPEPKSLLCAVRESAPLDLGMNRPSISMGVVRESIRGIGNIDWPRASGEWSRTCPDCFRLAQARKVTLTTGEHADVMTRLKAHVIIHQEARREQSGRFITAQRCPWLRTVETHDMTTCKPLWRMCPNVEGGFHAKVISMSHMGLLVLNTMQHYMIFTLCNIKKGANLILTVLHHMYRALITGDAPYCLPNQADTQVDGGAENVNNALMCYFKASIHNQQFASHVMFRMLVHHTKQVIDQKFKPANSAFNKSTVVGPVQLLKVVGDSQTEGKKSELLIVTEVYDFGSYFKLRRRNLHGLKDALILKVDRDFSDAVIRVKYKSYLESEKDWIGKSQKPMKWMPENEWVGDKMIGGVGAVDELAMKHNIGVNIDFDPTIVPLPLPSVPFEALKKGARWMRDTMKMSRDYSSEAVIEAFQKIFQTGKLDIKVLGDGELVAGEIGLPAEMEFAGEKLRIRILRTFPEGTDFWAKRAHQPPVQENVRQALARLDDAVLTNVLSERPLKPLLPDEVRCTGFTKRGQECRSKRKPHTVFCAKHHPDYKTKKQLREIEEDDQVDTATKCVRAVMKLMATDEGACDFQKKVKGSGKGIGGDISNSSKGDGDSSDSFSSDNRDDSESDEDAILVPPRKKPKPRSHKRQRSRRHKEQRSLLGQKRKGVSNGTTITKGVSSETTIPLTVAAELKKGVGYRRRQTSKKRKTCRERPQHYLNAGGTSEGRYCSRSITRMAKRVLYRKGSGICSNPPVTVQRHDTVVYWTPDVAESQYSVGRSMGTVPNDMGFLVHRVHCFEKGDTGRWMPMYGNGEHCKRHAITLDVYQEAILGTCKLRKCRRMYAADDRSSRVFAKASYLHWRINHNNDGVVCV